MYTSADIEKSKEFIAAGNRVVYTSDHVFGSVRRKREKLGTYGGLIRHTCVHMRKRGSRQMCAVQFDGNVRVSKVALCNVRAATAEDEARLKVVI